MFVCIVNGTLSVTIVNIRPDLIELADDVTNRLRLQKAPVQLVKHIFSPVVLLHMKCPLSLFCAKQYFVHKSP